MHILQVEAGTAVALDGLPDQCPPDGFLWVACGRREFEVRQHELQSWLQHGQEGGIVDLHVHDLLNQQLPSYFDSTSVYDLLVFRRLATTLSATPADVGSLGELTRRTIDSIDTSAVGIVLFDRVMLTVHPTDCGVRDHFVQRLLQPGPGTDVRLSSRMPTSTEDLMLRMVNHMVDSYLELRRSLSKLFGTLQRDLLDPKSRFDDWQVLLDARNALTLLEDTCEDQRSAIQEWIDMLDELSADAFSGTPRERELLRLRARDVLEHIERVLAHVRRLEQASETAVQMHFSALGKRTNDIMRTLTVLTAVFLPLNLITGFFGMNFDGLPLIHSRTGVWIAVAMMTTIAVALGGFFWRRRYLGSSRRR